MSCGYKINCVPIYKLRTWVGMEQLELTGPCIKLSCRVSSTFHLSNKLLVAGVR